MTLDPLKETLPTLFDRRVRLSGPRKAIWVRRGDAFCARTWNELADDVLRTASGLKQLVQPGDRVIQVSENRYEWIVLDLAIHTLRGVHVAVHATLTGPQIAYQIADSGAQVVVVSNAAQLAKLAAVADQLPRLTIFAHDRVESLSPPLGGGQLAGQAQTIADALLPGEDENAGQSLLDSARAQTAPEDLATILYTSGTTGEPKGVMLTHSNLATNALYTQAASPMFPEDVRVCWLPLSHIFARTVDYYTWIAVGYQLALAVSRDTVVADCRAMHPTLLSAVPYFYDKVCRVLAEQGKADEPGALAELLGGRLRACTSGGAALPDHVARFFNERGLPLTQGYGLTETSPVMTCDAPHDLRIGTVGRPIPGCEVRIAADGEILTRGPQVMAGYWNKPDDTAAAIREGWFHTGDLGALDADGRLRITGRKKELIVTAAGKNVAPNLLEALLTEDPLVAQAMVVGDGRNYLVALVVPDRTLLEAELRRREMVVDDYPRALDEPPVRALLAERIRQRLACLSHCEQVAEFALLAEPFTIEGGELTPTLKLRRGEIARKYAATIARMYGP